MWFYQIFHLYLIFNCSYCCRALEFAWSSTYSRVRTVANLSGLIDQNCSKAFFAKGAVLCRCAAEKGAWQRKKRNQCDFIRMGS